MVWLRSPVQFSHEPATFLKSTSCSTCRPIGMALNSNPVNSCHCSWGENLLKRMRMSHSGWPTTSPTKTMKKKKTNKKKPKNKKNKPQRKKERKKEGKGKLASLTIQVNTFSYVKKQNCPHANGSLFFHFLRKSS